MFKIERKEEKAKSIDPKVLEPGEWALGTYNGVGPSGIKNVLILRSRGKDILQYFFEDGETGWDHIGHISYLTITEILPKGTKITLEI